VGVVGVLWECIICICGVGSTIKQSIQSSQSTINHQSSQQVNQVNQPINHVNQPINHPLNQPSDHSSPIQVQTKTAKAIYHHIDHIVSYRIVSIVLYYAALHCMHYMYYPYYSYTGTHYLSCTHLSYTRLASTRLNSTRLGRKRGPSTRPVLLLLLLLLHAQGSVMML
jgi:hypothetical protein